jgi:hypothetical protein
MSSLRTGVWLLFLMAVVAAVFLLYLLLDRGSPLGGPGGVL